MSVECCYMLEEQGYMPEVLDYVLYDAMILLATQFARTRMCNEGHVPDHQGEDDYPQFKSILY